MASAVRRDGIGALYWGFFAFCMESFPYDIMELVRSWREAASASRSAMERERGCLLW
jgi:hypothetical protein